MLPDWPREKGKIRAKFNAELRQRVLSEGPVMAQVARVTIGEGRTMSHVYPNRDKETFSLERHEVTWEVDHAKALASPDGALSEAISHLSKAMAEQMETELFSKIREAPREIGGFIRGDSNEEIASQALAALRQMRMTFDHDGKPEVFFVMSNANAELLAALKSPELEEQARAIVEEKRREWMDRESRRRLVD